MKFRLILIAIGLIAGIYSCSNSTENSDVLTKPTIEILASDPVPMQIKSIINVLGLAIEKPNPYINSPSDKEASILSAKEGVIVEYSYHDGSTGRDYSFKISEEESTKDKLVYYGSSKDDRTGGISELRKTISVSENGIMVKTDIKDEVEGYVPRRTMEFVQNGNNAVDEYSYNDAGEKLAIYQYQPNTQNTLIKKSLKSDENWLVDSISIIQK